MTDRQRLLARFLIENCNEYTYQNDIVEYLMPLYGVPETANFHDSNSRQRLTADIRALNESPVFPYIIVSTKQGIKIADRAEFSKHIKRLYREAFSRLKRAKILLKKADKEGQLQFDAREKDLINRATDLLAYYEPLEPFSLSDDKQYLKPKKTQKKTLTFRRKKDINGKGGCLWKKTKK